MTIDLRRDYLERYGFRLWCLYALCGIAGRAVGFRALRGMTLALEDIDPKYLTDPPPFCHRKLTALEFRDLDGAAELAEESFYQGAAKRGDWCHCMCHGDTVASYGWYATAPVPAIDDDHIGFSPEYVYMYKGFSVPEFRGHQLHAYGMGHAASEAVSSGYRGLISFVEIQNESSLRSVARLGYRTFGTCFRVRLFGRTLAFSTPGCRRYGFGLLVAHELRGGTPAPGESAARASSHALTPQDRTAR
jgi:hypothetical protein